MNRCEIFIEVDEIDHITYAYHKGKGFDKIHAARLIRRYAAENADVAAFCAPVDPIFADLESFPAEELERLLAGIRNILLHTVWDDQPLPTVGDEGIEGAV